MPHPFVNGAIMAQLADKPVALVGQVLRLVEQHSFILCTTDKLEVKVTGYNPQDRS